MTQDHPTPPETAPQAAPAPPGEPETHAAPNRRRNIERLAQIIDWGMIQAEAAHTQLTQAGAAQAGQPAPQTPDPAQAFERATRIVAAAMTLQDRFEQHTTHPQRSAADQARDAARAIRRRKEAQRSEIRHKLDASLPNIRQSEAMAVRRDIEEALAGDTVDALLETQSIAEIALTICQDLGLAPDLSKWTDAEIGYVHHPRPIQKSTTNWIPVVNAAGLTNYFAGPPTEPVEPTDPCGPPYRFPDKPTH